MPRKRSRLSSKKHSALRAEQWFRGCKQYEQGKPAESPIDPYYRTREWRTLRDQVLERDRHTCMYCGDRAVQVDHVMPRKQGGADADHNLVACCTRCNRIAGGKVFDTFDEKKWWLLGTRKKVPAKRSHYEETMRLLRKKGTRP